MIRSGLTVALFLTAGVLLALMHPSTPAFQTATAKTPSTDAPSKPAISTDLRYLSTLSSGFQDSLVAIATKTNTISQVSARAAASPTKTTSLSTHEAKTQNALPDHKAVAKPVMTDDTNISAQHAATNLEQLVVKALQQDQSDTYINTLVEDMPTNTEAKLPLDLLRQDGQVDTSALLANLSNEVEHPIEEGDTDDGTLTHLVKPGESLASISYRFFGRADLGGAIYTANRNLIESPDHLKAGTLLTIPEL